MSAAWAPPRQKPAFWNLQFAELSLERYHEVLKHDAHVPPGAQVADDEALVHGTVVGAKAAAEVSLCLRATKSRAARIPDCIA
jgi:hypothetical protein